MLRQPGTPAPVRGRRCGMLYFDNRSIMNMDMTTMTLKVQYLTQLEGDTQIQAGWYVTTPYCPGVVFATEQEALAYGRTEELRQELINRVRALSFDELRALKMKMT